MDKSRTEFKVGIFVFAALVILGFLILRIGNIKDYGRGYPLKIIFGNASGVRAGSPVMFSGVDAGEVQSVRIIEDQQAKQTQIEIIASIRRTFSIPRASRVYIGTLGLLGEKYIEIIPPKEFESFLQPGETLIGVEPILPHFWLDEGERIVTDLSELIQNLKDGEGTAGRIFTDESLYEELSGLISDIRKAKEGTIGKLLFEDTIYKELKALVEDLRRNPWKLLHRPRGVR